ncbi:MAG: discoidin domain-containing protein, partial [Leptospira sp.]|nr:discoidin domain-containing protein [Leptospira sp.]
MSDKSIRISHPRTIPIKKISGKGNVQFDQGKFHSYIEDLDKNNLSVVQLEFGEETDFNSIRLSVLEKEKDFFPNTFRFEISSDGIVWEPIIQEVDFRKLSRNEGVWHFSLIRSRFLKLVAKPQNKSGSNSYRMAFANLKVMISGVVKISASSENDRLWVKENLIDERPDYGWSSAEKNAPGEEFFIIDLGSVNRVDEVRLLSKNSEDTHFPEHFVIYYSEDDLSWYQLLEEPRFISQPATWYRWRFLPANIRFLKLVAIDNPTSGKKSFITQITEIELFAAPDLIDLSKRERSQPLPYSSVLRSGLVRLAVDGEVKEGVAIQGNDRRLRDATTEFKGIVELASDGEEKEGVVVQGNDKRLKIGTELIHGLARLARSGESKPGLVVQSDDERIRGATVASAGIVELAEDGETRPGVVVQGNDSRLKKATAKGFGLVLHASHGENSAGKVVTADDPRLQDATTEKSG